MKSTLVLLRHGQSTWNLENRFTGWTDVDLTEQGMSEAVAGGKVMADEGLEFDVVHTSVQLRAIKTAQLALEAMGQLWIPVERHWRLNERHYGALQGLNKKETAEKHGVDQVKIWRRAYDIPPPPLDLNDERHPRFDPRYSALAPEQLPATECLEDVVKRMLPYWHDRIIPQLRRGMKVLIVAHGNSLRALVAHLDGLTKEEVLELNIPTGVPLMYQLDENMAPSGKGRYLGDAEAAKAAAEAVAKQAG